MTVDTQPPGQKGFRPEESDARLAIGKTDSIQVVEKLRTGTSGVDLYTLRIFLYVIHLYIMLASVYTYIFIYRGMISCIYNMDVIFRYNYIGTYTRGHSHTVLLGLFIRGKHLTSCHTMSAAKMFGCNRKNIYRPGDYVASLSPAPGELPFHTMIAHLSLDRWVIIHTHIVWIVGDV